MVVRGAAAHGPILLLGPWGAPRRLAAAPPDTRGRVRPSSSDFRYFMCWLPFLFCFCSLSLSLRLGSYRSLRCALHFWQMPNCHDRRRLDDVAIRLVQLWRCNVVWRLAQADGELPVEGFLVADTHIRPGKRVPNSAAFWY